MNRFTVKKRLVGKPGDTASPYWIWDRSHGEFVVGWKRRKEALVQCEDWNADELRKEQKEKRLKREAWALAARSRFKLIQGGAA